jgi:hypothetical protein
VGELKIPLQLPFQITKYLTLAFFDLKLEKIYGYFGFGDFNP